MPKKGATPTSRQPRNDQPEPQWDEPHEVVVKRRAPRPPALVMFGWVMSVLTCLGNLLVVVANILLLLDVKINDAQGLFGFILRIFNILLAFLACITEFGNDTFFEYLGILAEWAGRGTFQLLVACIVLAARHPDEDYELVAQISGAWVGCTGVIYMLCGLMCLRSVHRRHKEEHTAKKERHNQLDPVVSVVQVGGSQSGRAR